MSEHVYGEHVRVGVRVCQTCVSVYMYVCVCNIVVCTNRDHWTRGSYYRLDHRVPIASRPIRTFFSVAGITHIIKIRGVGRGERRGETVLRVSYNLTNIQTFRGVCNSEECISVEVALNSIRRRVW